MTFVRTVLGDIDPGELGITYAHEHLVIDRGRAVELYPDFDLSDVATMATEVRAAAALGLADRRGRDALRHRPERPQAGRAEPADRRQHRRADRTPPRALLPAEPLAPPDRRRTTWPTCSWRTSSTGSTSSTTPAPSSGGPSIGPASSRSPAARVAHPSTDRPAFEAAAIAHARTGVPILTHCENGTGALEQVELLAAGGVAPTAHRAQPCRQGRRSWLSPGGAGERRLRRVRRLVSLGRQAERDAPAARMDGRRRPARPGPARDGRCPSGLLPRLRRPAGTDVAARRVHRPDGRARARCRQSGPAVRPQPCARLRVRGRHPMEETPDDRSSADERRRFARSAVVARRGSRRRANAANSARWTSRRCSTTRSMWRCVTRKTPGIDVVSDGEMRRTGFFTAEFYHHLTGVRALPPDRRLGAGAHDQQHRFEVLEPIAAPDGLGVIGEYRYAVTRTNRPLKVTLPGSVHAVRPTPDGPGEVYPDRDAAAAAFVPILRVELEGLADAGAELDPDRRAVARDPSRRALGLLGAVQRRRRARRGTRPDRRAPVLRELSRSSARAADIPARPRGDARLPRR